MTILDTGSRLGTRTLNNGLRLLELVVDKPETITSLAQATGLPTHSVYRLAATLKQRGYVKASTNGKISAGRLLLKMRVIAEQHLDFLVPAKPMIEKFVRENGLSTFSGYRDGDESVHVHCISSRRPAAVSPHSGKRQHVCRSGFGRALLLDDDETSLRRLHSSIAAEHPYSTWRAAMSHAAQDDIILSLSDPDGHAHSVSTPIRNGSKAIIGALEIIASPADLTTTEISRVAPLLRALAGQIGQMQ
jgi:DNA-binding IclR family transcriptional regulator